MKIMTCPLNGPRNISEFVWGGEVKIHPPLDCTDAQWAEFAALENNTAGVVREWWYHTPTAYWFIAERNTITDEIVRTYPAREVFKDRVVYEAPKGAKEGA